MTRKVYKDVKTFNWYTAETKVESENGVAVNVQNFERATFFVKTTNKGGTNPTLDIKFQTKDPNTEDWVDLDIVFAQITTDTSAMLHNIKIDVTTDKSYAHYIPLGQYIRPVLTIGGTTPTFDIDLSMIAKS